jgi:HK97 family phage major capsid protein
MVTLKNFLIGKGITEVAFKDMAAEDQANLYNEMNEANSLAFKALSDDVTATKESIEAAKDDLRATQTEQLKALNEALKEQGLAIKALSEPKSILETGKTIKDELEANKAKLELLKNGTKGEAGLNRIEFTTKAAGTMLFSSNVSGGNVPVEERIAGLNSIATRTPRLLDLVSRRSTSSNVVSWVYQANKDGAAGQTTEGTVKNQIDFDLVVANESIKKTTAYIKVSTEMLDDIDFIQSEINQELTRELLKAVELGVYSGAGTTNTLHGIRTTASAFAAGSFALAVDNANQVDVLAVALNQIKVAQEGRYPANAILMHPTDVTKLKLVKLSSTDKRYVDRLMMVGSTLLMDGIQIIETTLVTVGEYLVGAFEAASVYEKDGVRIEIGLDGNDFTNNTRTIIAEWRGLCLVKNNDRSAFVKGVFATDQAALETV